MSSRPTVVPTSTFPVRALRAAGLVALLGGAAACASIQRTIDSYTTAPNGLALPDDRLRRALALGRYDTALARAADKERGAPGDRLLRGMYAGLVAYYAGEYDRSTGAFERVYQLTDDRLTRRVSKEAASLVTNDRALPWMPSPSERLLARHFAMMAFLRRSDVSGAAVEARRLVTMLQELDDQKVPVERSTRAMLHYVAGAVFEAAGERNDADVAWRNAAALGLDVSARPEPPARDDSATIVVLVEHGWVAHKVEQSLTLAFGTRDEIAGFADDDGRRAHEAVLRREAEQRKKSEEQRAKEELKTAREGEGGPVTMSRAAPPPVRDADDPERRERRKTKTVSIGTDVSATDRLFGLLMEQERDEWYVDRWDRPVFVRSVTDASHVLTIAWPAFARPEPAPAPMAVTAFDGDSLVASDLPMHVASLSDAVVADFRRQRTAVFARAVARAATKYWLAEKAEKKKKWAGVLVNAAGELLEHADTRSWHLLPAEVSVVRLRVPAGTHNLTAQVADPRRGAPASLELGRVTVHAGETRVVSGRVWAARMPRPPLPVAPRSAAY